MRFSPLSPGYAEITCMGEIGFLLISSNSCKILVAIVYVYIYFSVLVHGQQIYDGGLDSFISFELLKLSSFHCDHEFLEFSQVYGKSSELYQQCVTFGK